MVEWKAVSNTAICGTFSPKTSWQARMPCRFTLLCSGASGINSSMVSITSWLIRTAVAYRGDLGQIFDHAHLGIYQSVLDLHERRNVIGHVHRQLLLAAVGGLMAENTVSKANSLTVSFCEHFFIGHINQLIFQG